MLNTIYRLDAPRHFDLAISDIKINNSQVVVRPTYLSICQADQRYYQGKRAANVLSKKLPMALIHEGIGKVVFDPTNTFKIGQEVVMIPNIPFEDHPICAENYLRSSKFRASNIDGFMQEYICSFPDRFVPFPESVDRDIAAFTELVSVSYHAVQRFKKIAHSLRNAVGIWGDGNLGYITALLVKYILPQTKLYVFGIDSTKLSNFTFADEVFFVNHIPQNIIIDHAFECVGGMVSSDAINQIIDIIAPEGTLSLLGVNEDLTPINTRMVLEKGLRIFGSSRSGRSDFCGTVKLYQEYPDIVNYLHALVGTVLTVRSIKDATNAFEIDINKMQGKTIMKWEI